MIKKKTIGNRTFYIDNGQQLAFTKTEMTSARSRYSNLLAKKLTS